MLAPVPDPAEEVSAAIRELIEANRSAREAMRQGEAILRRALRKLEQGADVPTMLRSMPADAERQTVNHVLEAYAAARHRLRQVVIAECLDQGMTLGEIGRQWGFSRQLAGRLAREAKPEG
jgi:DNA-binding NarL/FixJ family response regulator